ncbi:MAG: nucleoside phosphorylase [Candidatus Binataceae bacterium]
MARQVKSSRTRATKPLLRRRFPILEYDPARTAILEPRRIIKAIDVPAHCVLCFFPEVLDHHTRATGREVSVAEGEGGRHPIHEIEFHGKHLIIAHPRIGAAMATAMLERLIALGCRKFIACGGAGVLDSSIAVGHIIVPTAAIRDEGTSYHYLPPSREIGPHPRALRVIEATLRARGVEYIAAKTWTTDGLFRETRARMLARKREGCLTVDMEAAAFFAAAKFRRVMLGQILYGADDLGGRWNDRGWMRHAVRAQLFDLAAEACLRM